MIYQRLLVVIFHLAVLHGLSAFATAQTYLPGAAPTADISHNTTETIPGPTTRLTVGIKETVVCAISNWNDPDIRVDGSVQTPVSDNYGTIGWAASNGGSCVPTTGPTTTYTACESATATTETVTMTAEDASTANGSPLGNDVAAITVTLSFSVLVPTGLTVTKDSDDGYGVAGTDFVGAKTTFRLQVNPATVSFKNVSFQTNAVTQTRQFPNGTNQTFGGTPSGYSVAPIGTAANCFLRTYSSGKNAKAVLWGVPLNPPPPPPPPAYINCTMIFSVPHEFRANGTWTEFDNATMKFVYTGATLKTTAQCKNVSGSDQGPWQ